MQIKRITLSEYQLVTGLFDKYRVFYKQKPDIILAGSFIKERLKNKESVIFVALEDVEGQQIPIGFTQLYPLISSARATRNWLLNDLYVDADYRKQGVGKALIKAATDFASSKDSTFVKLETAIDNYTAQRLYESIGFIKQEPSNAFFAYSVQLF